MNPEGGEKRHQTKIDFTHTSVTVQISDRVSDLVGRGAVEAKIHVNKCNEGGGGGRWV